MTSDVGLEVTVTELFFMEAEALVVVEAVIVDVEEELRESEGWGDVTSGTRTK